MLIAPCRTRWVYHFEVLQRLLEMKDVVRSLLDEVIIDVELSSLDWKKIAALVELLEPISKNVRELEGENYVTISKVIPSLLGLIKKMNQV